MGDLVWNYFKDEVIEDYHCDKCKQKTRIKKTQRIFKFPEILLVFIKRFRFFPEMEKIASLVEVPKEIFDLGDFIYGEQKLSQTTKEFLLEQKEHSAYQLIGLIEHYGSIDFGHYVSICLDELSQNWVLFNDEKTSNVDPKKDVFVANSDIYVMVFRNL